LPEVQAQPSVGIYDGSAEQESNYLPEVNMSSSDKAKNKAEELKGKTKQGVGRATNDPALEGQGKRERSKGNLKQAGEKIKDVFRK
jgi:uncharacterized protein YjbJ (UPF0337 family)